jgi:hypothetical protein
MTSPGRTPALLSTPKRWFGFVPDRLCAGREISVYTGTLPAVRGDQGCKGCEWVRKAAAALRNAGTVSDTLLAMQEGYRQDTDVSAPHIRTLVAALHRL